MVEHDYEFVMEGSIHPKLQTCAEVIVNVTRQELKGSGNRGIQSTTKYWIESSKEWLGAEGWKVLNRSLQALCFQ